MTFLKPTSFNNRAKSKYDLMRILSELVFIPQTQEPIGCCMIFHDFFFFIDQLFLIFKQMLSIRAFGRRGLAKICVKA